MNHINRNSDPATFRFMQVRIIARLVLICSILLAISFSTKAQTTDGCTAIKPTFKAGEKLEYKVYYNWKAVWMGAAFASFEVNETIKDGRPVLHTYAVGQTLKRYNWFYKVNDIYQSYLDAETYQPVHFIREIEEGSYSKQLEYYFNHESQEVFIDYMIRKGKTKYEDETRDIKNCTFDLLSIVYHTRNIDYSNMEINDSIPLNLFMDGRMYDVGVRFLGRDTLETEHGTFRCVKISPTLLNGYIFDGDEEMTIWATDDENKVPLLIESPLNVGAVKAYLTSYENLLYNMDSRIE